LDAYLGSQFPFLSRTEWKAKIQDEMLLGISGALRPTYKVQVGDVFYLYHPPTVEPEVDKGIYPIWKKSGIMACYKPSNLPMHENGPYRKNTFAAVLVEDFGEEWAAVHRLDRETSGIVLCGNTPQLRKALADSLAQRAVQKRYIAIGAGRPLAESWVEKGPIGDLKGSEIRIKKWVVADGLPAETFFRVKGQKGEKVLLEAWPKTGRTNQIRIHAAYAGLPLLGEKLYHPDENVFLDYFNARRTRAPKPNIIKGADRLCLHAESIEFTHPESGERCIVHCPPPEDMLCFW
tara:strand:+ start:70 stop:942 length:873 start_codon:yes stop_codon:yes gene_type:complete